MCTRRIVLCSILCLSATAGLAQESGEAYVIEGARIFTVSGPVIERGSVVIKDGRIGEVGKKVKVPRGAKRVDARGLSVYPGLFYADSQIGVKAMNERTLGPITPELQSYVSFHFENSDAEVIRQSGITEAMVRPIHLEFPGGFSRPGLLPAQASVLSLQGGSPEDMVIARGVGPVLNFPTVGMLEYFDDERFAKLGWSEVRQKREKELATIRGFFNDARDYMTERNALTDIERKRMLPDLRFESMIPVLKGEKPLLIDVDNHVDIRDAVEFAEAEGVDYVLLGAADAWRELAFLRQHDTRLIITGPYKVSESEAEDNPVNIMRQLPALLYESGIRFALASQVLNGVNSRVLPYEAGVAVAHGLPWDIALRSVTLAPAEILGVDHELGSIDTGKRANIVIADGDILEPGTRVTHMFINGKPVNLETEYDRLYEHYRDLQ